MAVDVAGKSVYTTSSTMLTVTFPSATDIISERKND